MLVHPVVGYNFKTEFYKDNETTKPLDTESMQWFSKYYVDASCDGFTCSEILHLVILMR